MLGSPAVLVPCTNSRAPGPLEHLTQNGAFSSCRGALAGPLDSASVPAQGQGRLAPQGCGCCSSAHAGTGNTLPDPEQVPTSWQGLMSLSKISAWSRARGKPSTCRAREQLGLMTHRCSI